MVTKGIKKAAVLAIVFFIFTWIAYPAIAEGLKIGHVDLRKAFYDYEKTKDMEKELNDVTEAKTKEREQKVAEITKKRDELAMLANPAKEEKQKEVDAEIQVLQEYDKATRQELLNKKNDMFREIVDDVQKIVKELGTSGGYDYIMDTRSIMFAKDETGLTAEVLTKLNDAYKAAKKK